MTRNLWQNNIPYNNASYVKDGNDSMTGCLKHWLERECISPNDSGLDKVDSFWAYVEKNHLRVLC